ncbi:MAG: HEPN domain-containing protein [Nitrospinae bacterium]|nr:HEPN domain-containing protein [Nitrospinota bacterium]MBF0634154.1 HEPN domain-containing protein [Nitrospinota bacterium]
MTKDQSDLLEKAKESLKAAKMLANDGFYDFAASRAYYAMFYVAEAFLLGKGMAFSKHAGVHSAFGKHFIKTGLVPQEFHTYLIHGMEIRHAGDYGTVASVPCEESESQISHAEKFIELADQFLSKPS